MKWHIAVPVVLGGGAGILALTLGVVRDLTPSTFLLIVYLVSFAVLGLLVGLIVWAVETVQDEIFGATEMVFRELRASSALDELLNRQTKDGEPGPHLRSVKP